MTALACLRGVAWVAPQVARVGPAASAARGRTARAAGENMFERLMRVGKANIDGIISGLEDPEKVLDQTVTDMQNDLVKVRQAYAEVLATQRKLKTQKEQADGIAQEWYQRAELAVSKGDDELAKEALTRRQTSVDKADDLGRQLEGIEANVDRLFDSVSMLEDKIRQAKDEKEQLIARARTAKTTAKVNEMLSDVDGGSGAAGAFERMRDKVEMMETKADVSENLLPGGAAPGSVEDRFKALESGNKVDDMLAKMKGEKALPEKAGGIDSELEAMRKKLKESEK